MSCKDSGVTEINTPPCVGETCTPTVASCASCGCDPCQCTTSQTSAPLPFYNQACEVQEAHTKILVQQTFTTAVSVSASFNIPVCNASITTVIPGVQKLLVGGYLWNPTFGYLKIVSFDFTTGRVVLSNECQLSNAAAGTLVPACTLFDVVDPPFERVGDCSDSGVYVTEDFVIPVFFDEVYARVNSTFGLVIGATVKVGNYVYYLDDVIDASVFGFAFPAIRIRNMGGGGPPGTTIHSKDSQGNCITLVVSETSLNPCAFGSLEPGEPTGSLVICADQTLTILNATKAGQVPTCVDATKNTVEFRDLPGSLEVCTILLLCMNIVDGVLTANPIVQDTSIFEVGDVIVFHYAPIEDVRWVITSIGDGTHMVISVVGGSQTLDDCVPQDTSVCSAPCCDQNAYDISQILSNAAIFKQVAEAGSILPGVTFSSALQALEISNTRNVSINVLVDIDYLLDGYFTAAEFDWASTNMRLKIGTSLIAAPGPAPIPVLGNLRDIQARHTIGIGDDIKCAEFQSNYSQYFHHSDLQVVPPQTNFRVDARFDFIYTALVQGPDSCCACANYNPHDKHEYNIVGAATYIRLFGI